MAEPTNVEASPRKFTFKKSTLSEKADKMWSESKNDFSAAHPSINHVHLEKKTLDDVLGKLAANKKEQEEVEQSAQSVSFVFGTKINDRVVKGQNSIEKVSSPQEKPQFTNLLEGNEEGGSKSSAFLKEAEKVAENERAKEVEKLHASTSVPVMTGEEADENMFQASCKLHAYDKDRKEYIEKGICTIRINQRMENGQSHHRIVARVSGTLRVVINSKIFADMLLERIDRRIKISAMGPDSSQVQIFLIKFGFSKTDTGTETDQFFNAVRNLLKMEKGESSRKRKADCDLNADNVKLREAKHGDLEHSESPKGTPDEKIEKDDLEGENTDGSPDNGSLNSAEDTVDDGFVIVEKPDDESADPQAKNP